MFDNHFVDVFPVLELAQNSFESDRLPLLKVFGKPQEIGTGEDAMASGAGLVSLPCRSSSSPR